MHPKFLDCLKEDNPILKRFFYNETVNEYRPCYKTCKKCLMEGDADGHHCLECESGFMFRPGNNPKNNCVVYSEYYYISPYNQFKPLNVFQCPDESKYMIKDKKSCIDDCTKDDEYKYLYNGNCVKECPSDTEIENFICKVQSDECTLGQNELNLIDNNLDIIETLVRTYLSEFNYTKKHISKYNNENYTIIIYENSNCIKELSLEMPNVDFQSCYKKVQDAYNIKEDLIISIADKKELINPKTFFSFFNPISGEKLNADEICKNDTIIVEENLNNLLDKNNSFYSVQTFLTAQGINIFDSKDPFFTDICYDFDNPLKKDIPLNSRVKDLFPNATLCDEGCQYSGINLADMTATCDCKFNDITNNALIKDNAFLDAAFGEIFDLINSSNILVLKCFKYIFKHFVKSIGGWISLFLILVQIVMVLLYFLFELPKLKVNLFTLTSRYISYASKVAKLEANWPPKRVIGNKNPNNNQNDIVIYGTKENLENKKENDKLSIKKLEVKNSEAKKMNPYNSNIDLHLISSSNKKEDSQSPLETKNDYEFFKEFLLTSPDDMEYDDALVLEKRTFGEHFLECLKEKQIVAHTIISNDILKPRTMKVIVFILSVILYFVVNGLLFSESVIAELYELDKDKENFFSYFPRSIERIIYSTLVSIVISIIVDFFFIEENKLKLMYKREKSDPKVLKQKIIELINDIKKRNIAFIIIASIILLFSFFYLLCFNYVYPYSQIEWIKSSITIVIIMQFLSFLKCLLESGLKYLSFTVKSEKLYKISKLID